MNLPKILAAILPPSKSRPSTLKTLLTTSVWMKEPTPGTLISWSRRPRNLSALSCRVLASINSTSAPLSSMTSRTPMAKTESRTHLQMVTNLRISCTSKMNISTILAFTLSIPDIKWRTKKLRWPALSLSLAQLVEVSCWCTLSVLSPRISFWTTLSRRICLRTSKVSMTRNPCLMRPFRNWHMLKRRPSRLKKSKSMLRSREWKPLNLRLHKSWRSRCERKAFIIIDFKD